MIINKIDDKEHKNLNSLSLYLKKYNLSLLEYYKKFENLETPKCWCGEDCKFRFFSTIPTFYKTCGSKDCIKNLAKNRITSDDVKEKIRKSRFKYLSEKNGKTAWEKRSRGEFSYLENWFIDKCKKFNLFNNYDVIYDYSVYPYFIDFAFINEKIAVEMDGKCHFSNGDKRVDHDFKKDDLLVKKGWRIFRIRFDQIENDSKIDELVDFIGSSKIKNYENRLYKYIEIKNKKISEKNKIILNRNDEKLKYNMILVDIVSRSKIDFSKHGWVKKVSNIINKRHGKVNIWMKKYMKDFYENECFKRGNKLENDNNKKIEESIEIIKDQIDTVLKSDIDFSNRGWQKKLSKLLNLDRTSCVIWTAKHMPDTLEKSYGNFKALHKNYTELVDYYKINKNLLYKKQYKLKKK